MSWSDLLFRGVPALVGASLLGGCTTSSNLLAVQAKYTYPGGDYEPRGYAVGEVKYTRFFSAPVMDREVFLSLQQKALDSRPDSDLLVNYLVSSNVVMVPFNFLPVVSFTTFRVEGTAIKFRSLGVQQFRDTPAAVPNRTP